MTKIDVVQEAINRWESKNGWKADYAVVQGFQIVINEQYEEIVAENKQLRNRIADLEAFLNVSTD